MTVVCALFALAHITAYDPLTETEKETIRQVRADFAQVFLKKDAIRQIRQIVDTEPSLLGRSELGTLLLSFPVPAGKGQLSENLRQAALRQTGVRHNSLGESSKLRIQVFLKEWDAHPNLTTQLLQTYPYDFLAHDRFAFLSLVQGYATKPVEDAIKTVEELTDSHPIVLQLRAMRDRTPSKEEQKDRRLWEKRRMKAMISLKLRDYAWKLLDPTRKASAETLSWAKYLRKKGFTPPEPTAEEYAAVKKRGWAFNKQMLEPFKKVD